MWPLYGAGSVIRGGAPPFPHAVAVLPPLPANQNHNHNHHHHHHQHYHDHHHHHHHQPPTPQGEFVTVCLFRLSGLHRFITLVLLSLLPWRGVYYLRQTVWLMHAKQHVELLWMVESNLVGLQASLYSLSFVWTWWRFVPWGKAMCLVSDAWRCRACNY